MPGMSIGEVARRMGLRPSAIRYYERLGLIAKAPRVSGRRQYDDHVLERLAMVRFAKHVGFSVAEIKVLLGGVQGRPPTERQARRRESRASRRVSCPRAGHPKVAIGNVGSSMSEIGRARPRFASAEGSYRLGLKSPQDRAKVTRRT